MESLERGKTTLKNDNTMWVYYMLKLMDLYRYHTGAAQPGLAVKKLNTIDVIVADINLQNQFAAFVHQINKSKFVIHKFLYCTTHNTKSIIKPRPNTKESGKTAVSIYYIPSLPLRSSGSLP